ncbi:MAG: DUF6398 domain-containing protein [Pseudomonadota bacterium]
MKIGRNDPCPCGSGKKYKKCCLRKKVTPPEDLQYRRLSEVYDKLFPKLIEHGVSVFGKRVVELAMAEFLAWPEPDAAPDAAAIERAEAPFWPWFLFNWEYVPIEDEEGLVSGPEDKTIAELFMQHKKTDPASLEGKFILAANRVPYSFHEILAVDVGHTVTIRDVLTGAEMLVQERRGSESMKTGDIIFGRAIAVDGVGMFLGLSAFVLPPRMKPELIRLRREMIKNKNRLTHEDLYDGDLEIRQVFLEMDRTLHAMPTMVNTDGDPMEFHKLVYDIDSTEMAVSKLAPLCATESINEIFENAEKNKTGDIARAAFCWSRKGNRTNQGMPNTVLGNIEIAGTRLTVSVNSAQRARTIRDEIDRCLGPAARFRFDEISDMTSVISQAEESRGGQRGDEDDLMANPQVLEHLAQMLRMHWNGWVDEKLPALDYKTPRQAVKTADGRESVAALLLDAEKLAIADPVRASFEMEMIADVRRRLKLDVSPAGVKGTVDPENLAVQIERVKNQISVFGGKRLHEIYTAYCLRLCDTIAGTEGLNLHRGRPEIWSAAIVHAIAQLNFLLDPETPNHLTVGELASWFGVKKQTMSNKSSLIRDTVELFHDDARFCAPHVTRIFEIFEDEHGILHPGPLVNAQSGKTISPIPLKPRDRKPAAKAGDAKKE